MPVSVVVGGQFGSEGKGKVALEIARRREACAVVRVGGTNSGHTAVSPAGRTYALRQLPAAALAPTAIVILPPGGLINPDILEREIGDLGISPERIKIDPKATVISHDDIQAEEESGLVGAIGSTASGTGAALQRRIARRGDGFGILAADHPVLRPYLAETTPLMRSLIKAGGRVVVEGTQGFGLSLLHGGFFPKATSRDTTAASFIGEAGLSPIDVDEITLVIRTFPIRVAGDSGPLAHEISWTDVARQACLPPDFCELTTATKKIRRVARFDPAIVLRAIEVNNPTQIVLNHVDYVDPEVRSGRLSRRVLSFLRDVEEGIKFPLSWLGTGPASLVPYARDRAMFAA